MPRGAAHRQARREFDAWKESIEAGRMAVDPGATILRFDDDGFDGIATFDRDGKRVESLTWRTGHPDDVLRIRSAGHLLAGVIPPTIGPRTTARPRERRAHRSATATRGSPDDDPGESEPSVSDALTFGHQLAAHLRALQSTLFSECRDP